MNSYEILGLSPTANKAEIKRAYKRLALLYHPDRQDGNVEKFMKVQIAYETLLNEEKQSFDWWLLLKKKYPWIHKFYPNGWQEVISDLHCPSRLCEKVLKGLEFQSSWEKDLVIQIELSRSSIGKQITIDYEAMRYYILGRFFDFKPTTSQVTVAIHPHINYEEECVIVQSFGNDILYKTNKLSRGDLFIEIDFTDE